MWGEMDYYFSVMKYDVVIFDLDGTLLDTLDDLTDGVNHALAEFGYPLATRDEIRSRLGYGSGYLIASSVPGGRDCPVYQQVFDCYFEYYRAHSADKTRPYPGIMELLAELKRRGVRRAIVSNKPHLATLDLAKEYFDGFVESAVGDQPGVVLHANGRVANIDLAGFGIKGILPKEIGNLTELVQLHLGSHNEQKQYWETDPVQGTPVGASKEEKDRLRMERHRAYMKALHPAVQTSAPVALALREHNIAIDAISSYQDYTNDEISAFAASGTAPRKASDITTFDMNAGKMTNGLEGIDPAIGNLKKLEILFIANSPIKASGIPETIGDLSACTDLEIYNCTNLGELPKGIERMPSLIQVNLSNNNLGKGDDSDQNAAYNALQTLATGASRNQIQMIYFLNNNLRTIPDGIASMQKIGLLDFSNNNLHGTIKAFGPDFSPIEIYFDNNNIEAFENTPDFWRVDDMDVFSANYNKLTEFPNVFTADTDYSLSSISLAYNQISSFPADFRGLRTETLTLSANKMKSFPKELFGTDGVNTLASYVLMTANGMRKFPKDCFKSKYSTSLMSLDLSYNNLSELPEDFNAETFPYLYGVELSYNNFTYIPVGPLNSSSLTVLGMRGQRDDNGERCLKDWYQGIGDHTGLRGLYLGSNDLRVINDNISYLIFYLDISDNPNITFDASDICYYWQAGAYNLYYDKTQNILNCDAMLE